MRYLSLLCLVSGVCAAAPVPAPPPKPARKPVDADYEPHVFLGRVESMSDRMITVKPEGRLRVEFARRTSEGVREEWYYEQDNNQPAKTFTFADRMLEHNGVRLPPGRGAHGKPIRCEYLIADVRVGDRVHVSYGTLRGELLCTSLTIMRRPGGRVPDACGDDDPAYKVKVSTERNAVQCVEETIAGKWGPQLLGVFKR